VGRARLLRARAQPACLRQGGGRRHGGEFPGTEEELLTLPGIGTYTAAAIAAIAFDRRASPVDGNIERVIARLFAVEEQLPGAKPRIRALAEQLTPARRAGDFAQAMMDLGATICTPKKRPACSARGARLARRARAAIRRAFPRKAEKKTGALRRGAAFVALRADGHSAAHAAREGLLGGMTEVPTTEWSKDFGDSSARDAPFPNATWCRITGHVDHVFTHFPLQLIVHAANVSKSTRAPDGARWVSVDALAAQALPNVMRKVIAHALGSDALRPRPGFSKTRRAPPR
jgi:A/G-specific adenine glycosylase